jgi:replicative DNA helicase
MADDTESHLPAKPEIERALLGSLLLKSELWNDAAQILRPEDFSLEDHRRIFRVMLELGRKNGGFDDTSLAERLDKERPFSGVGSGVGAYLTDLQIGAVERRNLTPLCEVIREKAVLRQVAQKAEKLLNSALSPSATPEECWERASEIARLSIGGHTRRLQACGIDEFLALEIPAREMVLAPFLPAQGLVMLYSKRGLGKTYLALGIALAVASGGTFLHWKASKPRKVLFVDGELPASTLQQRIRSIEAGIPQSEPKLPAPDYLRIITPDMQSQPMPDLATPEGQMLVERELSGAELLVLDNLSALCRSGKENEGRELVADAGLAASITSTGAFRSGGTPCGQIGCPARYIAPGRPAGHCHCASASLGLLGERWPALRGSVRKMSWLSW